MTNWEIYVKESYDLVRRAECELTVNLPHAVEAYLVHLFAAYMDKPRVNTVPVGVKLLSARGLPTSTRKAILKDIGDECLLINSMGWGARYWPTQTYYADMGQMAYSSRAYVDHPPDDLFDELAVCFSTATRVLGHCKIN
jgi:hypothetical protein